MSSAQPERPMILGNCISCNGLMRVPVTTDVSNVACCPHCNGRFPVQQLIASAIPAAEIIQGEVAEDYTPVVDRVREPVDENAVKPRVKFEVPKQIYNGAKHRRRRRRSRGSDERKEQALKEVERSNPARPKIKVASVPVATTQSAPEAGSADGKVVGEVPRESSRSRSSSSSESSSSDSRSSRSRSRSRSSTRRPEEEEADSAIEWLKIGVGGFIAFPLAYLGLMWIAGLDPFGIAPTIHKVVPFVVPSRFTDDDTLPEFDDLDSELDDRLPMPSLDPDDV